MHTELKKSFKNHYEVFIINSTRIIALIKVEDRGGVKLIVEQYLLTNELPEIHKYMQGLQFEE